MRRLFSAIQNLFNPTTPASAIRQPEDWSDADAWDRYWRAVIADDSERTAKAGPLYRHFIPRFLPLMRERGMRRILFAGNGISLEPRALSHCGFDVTAVDRSPTACDFVRGYDLSPAHLGHFLPAYRKIGEQGGFPLSERDPRASLDRVRGEHRPGGSLTVLAQDFLQWNPIEPFDFLYAERAIQGFTETVRPELVRRFFSWLAPGGIAVVTLTHAPEELERRITADFKSAGFFVHLEKTTAWMTARPWPNTEEGRNALLAEYASQAAAERKEEEVVLQGGGKQLVLENSRS